MTPVCDLNPPTSSSFPALELKEDQQHLQLFLSPHQAAASLSSSAPAFLNTAHDQYHRRAQQHVQEGDKNISDSRWSDSLHKAQSFQAAVENESSSRETHELSPCKREDYEGSGGDEGSAAKWMPSRMRLMQKMMNSNCSVTDNPMKFTPKFQDHQQCDSNNNYITIRVCTDCNTTTTPLWRSGPLGPKSLCNACGIRQRKARRAMEAAAAGANSTAVSTEISSTKNKLHKEKKWRSGQIAQGRKLSKPPDSPQGQKKICSFKNLALSLSKNSALQRVFPQDVEEAAILLMELSCGFIQS